MDIRLECYEGEKDAALAALSERFSFKSVSKGYPNARQTGSSGTPCENRYYIKLADPPIRAPVPLADLIVTDMLRFFSELGTAIGTDLSSEIPKLRQFYLSSGGMTDAQKFELAAEWRASLLHKHVGRQKGGA